MATITPPPTRNLAEDNRRVRGPLDRLRGYIRTYVSLEGLTYALLFLAVCFWAGYVLDFGMFWLFRFDFIDYLPGWFRGIVLGLFGLALVALVIRVVLIRLFREFSDGALAMVLERRFPELLGDRLITAVELSDADKAAEYGYSKAMVLETIHEAADRVDQLPVREVFNWGRLQKAGYWVVVLTVLGYLLALGVSGAVAYYRDDNSSRLGIHRFNDMASIWFERNVLLQHRPWPRNAYLEVIHPSVEELRIGRDAPPPALRVRAYRYLIADYSLPQNWRPMTWKDLVHRQPELLGEEMVPQAPLDWEARDEKRGLTVDEVVLRVRQLEVRKAVDNPNMPATWNIADDRAASDDDIGGTKWRPLLWSDLASEKLGKLPVPVLSREWEGRLASAVGLFGGLPGQGALQGAAAVVYAGPPPRLTVDEVLKEEDQPQEIVELVKAIVDRLERLEQIQATLDKLDARIDERSEGPNMSRIMRKLGRPTQVVLIYAGKNKTVTKSLIDSPENPETGNEFTTTFSELPAETYRYWVKGGDYTTPERRITVLPPPTLVGILSAERRPAYLYYRLPAGADPAELRGKKQAFEPVDITSVGSDVSRREVPAGTDIVLTARASKPIDPESVSIRPFRDGDDVPMKGKPQVTKDEITLVFEDLRQDANFVVSFRDLDGVLGSRQIHLKPKDDQAPELIEVKPGIQTKEQYLEVIRKTKDGYMCTPLARIPFTGQIRDDNGLASVRYAFTLAKLESAGTINVRSLTLFAGVPGVAAERRNLFLALACFQQAQKEAFKSVDANPTQGEVKYWPLAGFRQTVREHVRKADGKPERMDLADVLPLLDHKQKGSTQPLLNFLTLDKDQFKRVGDEPSFDFPLWKLDLKPANERALQQRYKMQLWVEAGDTDVDSEPLRDGKTQPHISPSKERFQLLVVSEVELLSEVAKEEEDLRAKLEEVYGIIGENETKLIRENSELLSAGAKPEFMGGMAGRMETLDQVLDKQLVRAREVSIDYNRILMELQYNQIDPKWYDRVEKGIVYPLNQIVEKGFDQTRDKIAEFRKDLLAARENNPAGFQAGLDKARSSGTAARNEMKNLKDAIYRILENMQKVTDLNALIKKLRAIETDEQAQYELIDKIRKDLADKLLEDALNPKKP